MIVIFEGELNKESSQDLCTALLIGINNLEENDILNLYFSTEGGEHKAIYPIIDIILKNKDKIIIHLDHIVYSAGFLMIMLLKEVVIKLKPSFTDAMIHTLSFEVYTSDFRKKAILKRLKEKNKEVYSKLKELKLTAKELKDFKKECDVYFTKKRMLELFPYIIEDKYEL